MDTMPGIATLLRELPSGYEQACFNTGAILRKRDIKNPDDLMMLNLFHLITGCSLVEISAISKMAQIGNISDVAFMKRFKNSNEWFKWIIDKIITNGLISYELPENLNKYRILAVDASEVREKGRSGRLYRLHFALDITKMEAATYRITTSKIGEKLNNFEFAKNDLVLADRGYATTPGIEYCKQQNIDFILRISANNIRFCDKEGNVLDIRDEIIGKEAGEKNVYVKTKESNIIPVRICFKKKDEKSIEKMKKKLHRYQVKNQFKMSDKTKLFNEYIVVATSLKSNIDAQDVLDLYRYRWQVELYFKRLKSILDYGELPKKKEESIFAWLNGKLMVALLIEKVISKVSFFPKTKTESYEEYLARN